MKKFIYLILMLCYSNVFSLDSLAFKLTLEDELGSKNDILHFGIHKNATDTIDFDLGEVDAPQFTPPNELYAVFLVVDSTTKELFHTYYDFRPIPNERRFYKYYKFKIFNLGTPYTISWPKLKYIDSAFILDIFTGKLINVNMITQQSHWVENFSQNQFNILVYYNLDLVDVEEEIVNSDEYVFPNPASDEIFIKNNTINQYLSYMIVNELGISVNKGILNIGGRIEVDNLVSGTYFITLYDDKGYLKRYRFLKI